MIHCKQIKAVNDWASLPSELKRLKPKTIFNYKLQQFFQFELYLVFFILVLNDF